MLNKVRYSLFAAATISTMVTALFLNPVIAFADDSTPPPTEQPVVVDPSATDPAVTEQPVTVDPSVTDPAVEQLPQDVQLVVVDQSGDAVPLATADAAEALVAPDPYFTVAGTLYQFTATDCDPLTAGDQACATPIQAAIDFLSGNDYVPDDGNIYVEAGSYDESVYINGASWANTPSYLGLVGEGSATTTLNGSFYVENVFDFWLNGFTADNVYVNSFGNVTVSDTNVSSSTGYANMYVVADGYIYLYNDVANNSDYDGAYLISNGDTVYVENSEFNNNSGSGINATAPGDITVNYVSANGNAYSGVYLSSTGGNVFVLNSELIGNGVDGADAFAGDVVVDNTLAAGSGYDGVYLNGTNVFISNSEFSSNGEWDMYVDFSNYLEICDTAFTDTAVDGCIAFQVEEEEAPAPTPQPTVDQTAPTTVDLTQLPELTLDNLPADLPATLADGSTFTFTSGFDASTLEIAPGESVKVTFTLPDGFDPTTLAILVWNGTEWVEIVDFTVNPDGTVEMNLTFPGQVVFGTK